MNKAGAVAAAADALVAQACAGATEIERIERDAARDVAALHGLAASLGLQADRWPARVPVLLIDGRVYS